MSKGNRIFIIRHGESEANVANLIVSDPKDGVESWGLTDKGRQQAAEACLKLQELVGSNDDLSKTLVIISSDFKRARETAEVLHLCLKPSTTLRLDPRLRERNFGSLHLEESSNYQKVWKEDERDAHHNAYNCESVMSVYSRTLELIREIGREYRGKVVVLVSHGDTCQITRTGYEGLAPNEHRKLPHMGNCDLVELIIN